MSITSAVVLFVVLWFMAFLTIIPIRLQTQDEAGAIVPGTHAGAPEVHGLKKKAWIATAIAAVLWIIIAGIIFSGVISLRDIDFFHRLDWNLSDTEGASKMGLQR
jgi:predicted secreted protein